MGKYLIGLGTCALGLAPIGAAAQANCASRDAVVQRLNATYSEYFAGGGVRDSKSVFEVWISNTDEATWTILMTKADGTTCVMASGTNWREGMESDTKVGVPG